MEKSTVTAAAEVALPAAAAAALIAQAREQYVVPSQGNIEIDNDLAVTDVSTGDDGAYVAARVWVSFAKIGVSSEDDIPADELLIAKASELYVRSDGDIQIDGDAEVSPSDQGAFVAAWVWVLFEHANLCSECFNVRTDQHYHCGECDQPVVPDDPYYATPCGTYCGGCMYTKHAPECGICARAFDIPVRPAV